MTGIRTVGLSFLLGFAAALAACGGGGGGGIPFNDGGISGSGGTGGQSSGAIDGFGSVIVNGTTFQSNSAIITLDGVPGIESDLATGQVVDVVGDLGVGTAESISYRSDIKGPITDLTIIDLELGRATLTVLGQTVEVIAETLFNDTRLELLAAGQLVEVSGFRNSQGILVATFIEAKTSLVEYKVVGRASNATATSFEIDGLRVDYSSASLSNLAGGRVNDGNLLEVKADPAGFTPPDSLDASEVEGLSSLSGDPDDEFEVEGFITNFVDRTDFRVRGIAVRTTANTTFENGTRASLANNVKVEVEGVIASDGVLEADKVEIQSTGSLRTEGMVEAIAIGASTVQVLGVTFEIRPETELEDDSDARLDPFTLGDLNVGDRAEIRGYLDGSVAVAAELDREDPDVDARLRGPVTAENASSGTTDIMGITVTGDPNITQFMDADDNPISQSEFHAQVRLGTFVDAQWDDFTSTGEPANELSLEDDD